MRLIMKNIVRMIAAGLLVAGGFSALSAQERGIDRPVPADILSVDDYRRAERRLKAGVEAGKISKEDAEKRLIEMRKAIHSERGDGKKKDRDERGVKFRAIEEKTWAAVKAGKLSKDDAMKKLEDLKKEMFDDHGKKDWDGRKGSDVGIEALKRQLEALKRENEGLRKRLEKGKGR